MAAERAADVIVIGLGGWGSAAACELARRGHDVVGLDRFSPPHTHGSSHHKTRAFREAAPEHDGFVSLLLRAGELYEELGRVTGSPLLERHGSIYIGRPDELYVEGIRRSLERNGLPWELLEAPAARRRHPGFAIHDDEVLLLDPRAGVIRPERTIAAQLALARRAGAELRTGEPVERWDADDDGVRVTTSAAAYRAERLVLAVGPWAPELLELDLNLEIERQVVAWFSPGTSRLARADSPYFLFPYEPPHAAFYGFPDVAGDGVKVALHHGGATGRLEGLEHAVTEADRALIRKAVDQRLPALHGERLLAATTCWYTNAPDRLPIVGLHPDRPGVVIATADSGRGFKLAPVVGRMIADLVDDAAPEGHELMAPARLLRGARA